ncbi:MAG: glycosyltransferase [Acidobacteriia bacterium]|nr:glycosyltransferase [Terriglobia bacterium]
MGIAPENPLVTVVTPSYNQGRFIRATIESVLSQEYPHVEYIIMDGGSTDETVSVAKDYASRLTFISEKDRGQSHAINKGFHMARGSILSWLNSDDVFLPGSIQAGVGGFRRNPAAGAVYGEGYQMDREGNITSRFAHTERPNLWKLVYLSDYILQQTLYLRKDVLEDVGYLEEDLHYTMDWDLLIRIGLQYPLEYVPEFMGCLREYPEAKSFSGGEARIRELRAMLRKHTGMRFAPGAVVYGLDTYSRQWCEGLERALGPRLKPLSRGLQFAIRAMASLVIGHAINDSQGLYSDGCAADVLHYVLPRDAGRLVIEGHVPDSVAAVGDQRMRIEANGRRLGQYTLRAGDFHLSVDVPQDLQGQPLRLTVKSLQWMVPAPLSLRGDRRRIAFRLKSIRREQPGGISAAMDHVAENGGGAPDRAEPGITYFSSPHYRAHNEARLRHLASLGLPIRGRVLEVGSGPGDHTGFYLERECTVVATDGREECLQELNTRFPEVQTQRVDMNSAEGLAELGTFDIIHCYGLLYHLESPEAAIAAMSRACSQLLLLETVVSPGAGHEINPVPEVLGDYTQALGGRGCRPTRAWVFDTLKRYFPYVYQTRTQPDHPEFPTDWTAIPADHGLIRIVLVAARQACDLATLSPALLDRQESL